MGGPQEEAGTARRAHIYYYFEQDQQVWFLTVYGKDEAADLNAREKRALKAAIEQEKRQRARRRASRRK